MEARSARRATDHGSIPISSDSDCRPGGRHRRDRLVLVGDLLHLDAAFGQHGGQRPDGCGQRRDDGADDANRQRELGDDAAALLDDDLADVALVDQLLICARIWSVVPSSFSRQVCSMSLGISLLQLDENRAGASGSRDSTDGGGTCRRPRAAALRARACRSASSTGRRARA